MTNNDIGKTWTLYALGQLSEAWPRRLDFNALDLGTETGVGTELDSESEEVFDDLFRWLMSEGFVHFKQGSEGAAYGVQLTTKAMDAIGHTLPTTKGAVGTQLKTIAAGAGSAAGQAIIAETIGQLIGAAARSFAGGA
ncbi:MULTISPECIES: hypothetical protein [unclassified Aurantimonas]|uniref:hypothetical protein n=1 Tax=unclassified Aurantimonas TaxID=2638230 RepID=UPI002E197E37|nr:MULTISPECIES: hypothetical protein [unclassified Aurantimonas]MEC5292992.1 hypothetical protein [Aurantimonas sp. C2-3-R2]MEC5414001.1 hypothetical protein [Aurantimonas sp. C2-4-R8]